MLWAVLQPSYYAAFIGIFLTGLFSTSIWSLTYSLIQSSVQKAYYGRVIAYNDMVFLTTNALVSLMIGILAGYGIALEMITGILGLLFFGSAVYYKVIRSRLG